MKIKRVLASGELLGELPNTDDVYAQVNRIIGKLCWRDSVGNILFECEDGNLYSVDVGAEIYEVSDDEARQIVDDEEERRAANGEHQ